MNEMELKYGCNPNQKPSRIYMEDGSELPVCVVLTLTKSRQRSTWQTEVTFLLKC